jgi:hypothetical protein
MWECHPEGTPAPACAAPLSRSASSSVLPGAALMLMSSKESKHSLVAVSAVRWAPQEPQDHVTMAMASVCCVLRCLLAMLVEKPAGWFVGVRQNGPSSHSLCQGLAEFLETY